MFIRNKHKVLFFFLGETRWKEINLLNLKVHYLGECNESYFSIDKALTEKSYEKGSKREKKNAWQEH